MTHTEIVLLIGGLLLLFLLHHVTKLYKYGADLYDHVIAIKKQVIEQKQFDTMATDSGTLVAYDVALQHLKEKNKVEVLKLLRCAVVAEQSAFNAMADQHEEQYAIGRQISFENVLQLIDRMITAKALFVNPGSGL